jgi:hypothetical protein
MTTILAAILTFSIIIIDPVNFPKELQMMLNAKIGAAVDL